MSTDELTIDDGVNTGDIIVFDFDYLFNMLYARESGGYVYKLSTLLYQHYSYKYAEKLWGTKFISQALTFDSVIKKVSMKADHIERFDDMFFRKNPQQCHFNYSKSITNDCATTDIRDQFKQLLIYFKNMEITVYFLCIGDYRATKQFFKTWFNDGNTSLVKYIGTKFINNICGSIGHGFSRARSVGDTKQHEKKESILFTYKYHFVKLLNTKTKTNINNKKIHYYGFYNDCYSMIQQSSNMLNVQFYSDSYISNIVDKQHGVVTNMKYFTSYHKYIDNNQDKSPFKSISDTYKNSIEIKQPDTKLEKYILQDYYIIKNQYSPGFKKTLSKQINIEADVTTQFNESIMSNTTEPDDDEIMSNLDIQPNSPPPPNSPPSPKPPPPKPKNLQELINNTFIKLNKSDDIQINESIIKIARVLLN
jgi:hypothetical protein